MPVEIDADEEEDNSKAKVVRERMEKGSVGLDARVATLVRFFIDMHSNSRTSTSHTSSCQ